MSAALAQLKTPALQAVAVASRVQTILKSGGAAGEKLAQAEKLAASAAKSLEKLAAILEPRADTPPQDGTPFWATGADADADVKLVRFGVIPGKESWGLAMHTVEGDVWVSHEYYRLWWPLDVFPIQHGKKVCNSILTLTKEKAPR